MSQGLNTMKECNFSIWMNSESHVIRWPKNHQTCPNVNRIWLTASLFCCCGANEYLIRVHLFVSFFSTSLVWIFVFVHCQSAFLFYEMHFFGRRYFWIVTRSPATNKRKNSPFTHQTRIIYKIQSYVNRPKYMRHELFSLVCFYFHENHHSCKWHADTDCEQIFISHFVIAVFIQFYPLFQCVCQMKYVRVVFISHIRWTSSNYLKKKNENLSCENSTHEMLINRSTHWKITILSATCLSFLY